MHTTPHHAIGHHLPLAAQPDDGGKSSGKTPGKPPGPQVNAPPVCNGNIYADEIPQVAGLP